MTDTGKDKVFQNMTLLKRTLDIISKCPNCLEELKLTTGDIK